MQSFYEFDKNDLEKIKETYAYDFTNRAFNDLTLCSHISYLIRDIGIDGRRGDEKHFQWVERSTTPKWAERAIIYRDNGLCVSCKKNTYGEFIKTINIDHIVPLHKAGTNDIVNLQLLCADCNNKKSVNEERLLGSIPNYMQVKELR